MAHFICHSDEEKRHHACMNEDLTTADQSEIRKAYLVSVIATRKNVIMPARKEAGYSVS